MKVYVDASVILSRVLGQSGRIEDWDEFDTIVASTLTEVECLRTLDRLRIRGRPSERELIEWREGIFRLLRGADIVEVTRPVLQRASQPMPTTLGTLDAIHLATALLWRERTSEELTIATHDRSLANSARAHGLAVVGA